MQIKKILQKKYILAGIVLLVVFSFFYTKNQNKTEQETQEEVKEKSVEITEIGSENTNQTEIKTVGSVAPEAQIDVLALGSGTVKSLAFETGDAVYMNQNLGFIYSNSVNTSYLNAQTNYLNMQNNLDATKKTSDESIRQAELGVKNAEEAVRSAEIALERAENNLENSLALQEKGNLDVLDNAIISFGGYLNSMKTTLDQSNYIIGAEAGTRLANIDNVLGVKNKESVNNAKASYGILRATYDELVVLENTRDNIKENLAQAVTGLNQAKKLVDDTIIVLDNTISDSNFSETTLNSQKTAFSTLRTNVVNTQASAKSNLNGVENLGLGNKSETDALNSAVQSAENQLNLAKISYDNALLLLDSAKKGQEQQLTGAQISLDNAEGQLNISGNQVGDLNIKAPIAGRVTGKFVEVGTEVSAGQKIAEISQIGKVKVKISLASEDVYRIKLGQKVIINNEIEANITSIDPAADPVTKKVKVEILLNNQENQLITGTFVDVAIPVEKLAQTNDNSVYVPLRAVSINQSESFVFVVDGEQAKKVTITTGKVAGSLIEVTEGLSMGDNLVIEGNKNLDDGDIVKIK